MTARPSSRELRAAVVAEALGWRGTPYRHQAALRGAGCDCVGLVTGVWAAVFGRAPALPRNYPSAWQDAETGERLLDLARATMVERAADERRAGDVLVFRWQPGLPARHCGVLTVPPHRMVHAYQSAGFVADGQLHRKWIERIAGCFVFPAIAAAESGEAA